MYIPRGRLCPLWSLRTTPKCPGPKAESEDGEEHDGVSPCQPKGEADRRGFEFGGRQGEVEGAGRQGEVEGAGRQGEVEGSDRRASEAVLSGRLRLHVWKRDTDLVVRVVRHCVWWRFINGGGVEFAIGVRVGVLEVLRFARARTAAQATIPHWA
jgi:hypothetical protein